MTMHSSQPGKEVYDVAWAELHSVLHDRAAVEVVTDKIVTQALKEERERVDALATRKPAPYDRVRFTIAICPACGGRTLQTEIQRKAGGTYCYCKVHGTTKGDPTRCEQVEAVSLAALYSDSEGES